jgi:beta-lactamase regulating signal transducer with metallopeptidase domain
MPSDAFILILLRAQIALSLGLLAALALRAPARRLIGPVLAYRLWAIGPAAALTSLFPTLAEFIRPAALASSPRSGLLATGLRAVTEDGFWAAQSHLLLCAWLAGGAALALAFVAGDVRFRRLARLGLAGPAVVGVAAPRLVVPFDFAERFSLEERGFIRRHERTHMQRQDTLANLAIAAVQTLSWFNPLVHLAAACAHVDQELACDAQVVDGRPSDRRPYAEALMKVQLSRRPVGLSCAWAPAGRHPLEVRLSVLGQAEPSLRRHVAGAVGVVTLALVLSTAVWSLAPRNGPGVVAGDHIFAAPPSP